MNPMSSGFSADAGEVLQEAQIREGIEDFVFSMNEFSFQRNGTESLDAVAGARYWDMRLRGDS